MAKLEKTGKLSERFLVMTILPMILLLLLTVVVGYNVAYNEITKSKSADMASFAQIANKSLNTEYPGDYQLLGDEAINLFKGEKNITVSHDIVDGFKTASGYEVSLIYSNTRILTTVKDSSGVREIGSKVPDQICKELEASYLPLFFNKTVIRGEEYFVYYYPLFNDDYSYVGAIEICSRSENIKELIIKVLTPILIIELVVLLILVISVIQYNHGIRNTLKQLQKFTKEASEGNDSAELDSAIMKRKDEFGDIGESVLDMQRSMRDAMEKDPLTKLYNRRSANRKLAIVRSHFSDNGTPFSLSIGDIDFFKKVNDTYGHDAGDVVLQTVADTINEYMKDKGFVARWGGEEFLMVFDKTTLVDAASYLWEILDKIRALEIQYENQIIKITMSFGVACNPELSQDEIIKIADERLYFAKENGRNRVISQDEPLTALDTDEK